MESSKIKIPNSFNPQPFYFVFRRPRNHWFVLHDTIPYYSVAVLLEGSVDYELNEKEYHLSAGDILICPPRTKRVAKTKGFKVSDIDFYGDRIEGFVEPVVVHKRGFEKINTYMERINYLYMSGGDNYMAAVRGYVLIMLNELLSGTKSEQNRYVSKMKKYIIEHYAYSVTMADLAEITHLTPAYCGALFKKEMGCTVTDYVNKLRIDDSISYMSEEYHATLEEIALNVGYCDIYQFSKMFKRIVGVSPSEYRKINYKK